jgi:hypothetical protein
MVSVAIFSKGTCTTCAKCTEFNVSESIWAFAITTLSIEEIDANLSIPLSFKFFLVLWVSWIFQDF